MKFNQLKVLSLKGPHLYNLDRKIPSSSVIIYGTYWIRENTSRLPIMSMKVIILDKRALSSNKYRQRIRVGKFG